jgi:hypothetical protein
MGGFIRAAMPGKLLGIRRGGPAVAPVFELELR